MSREELVKAIKERFKEQIVEFFDKSPRRIYLEIPASSLTMAASYLYRELEARFNIATGLDTRTHLEILYHFTLEKLDLLISLRVKLDKNEPKVDSLTALFPAADWIEREIHELLGVDFSGHPNLKRLLLSEEWPPGVYPLKSDYREWDSKAIRDRGV